MTQRFFARRIGLFTVFLLGAPGLPAQDVRTVIGRFERAYRSSQTLQANFVQLYSESGKQIRAEAGVAYFGRPGKMRWEYHSPENNLYVIDGKWAWFYVPADHTVTRTKAKESSDWRTPLALLAGEMKVSKLCGRISLDSHVPSAKAGNLVMRCELRKSDRDDSGGKVRSAAEGERVLFEVDPANAELARLMVFDPGGIQVEFRFSGWQFDPRIDATIFRFAPPRGVAVVDGDFTAAPMTLAGGQKGPATREP